LTAREESDLGSFAPYIAKHEIVAAKTSNRVCIFCHFDAKGRIARYVVHYLTSLRQAGIDIYFRQQQRGYERFRTGQGSSRCNRDRSAKERRL